MVKKYAILNSNNVAINFVVWDGVTPFDYGVSQGNQIVIMPENFPENTSYSIGDIFVDGTFVPPNGAA